MVNCSLAEALSVALLLAVLAYAIIRRFGWPEAVVAVPAARVVIATGAISLGHVRDEAARLGPVIGFLAAVWSVSSCATPRVCSMRAESFPPLLFVFALAPRGPG